MVDYDPYSGDSGLRSDFDGEVVLARFEQGTRGNYNLELTFDIDGEEYKQRYSVGKDWVSYDGGETIEHPNGEKARFNNRTAYFDFISAAMGSGGEVENELRRRNRELYDNHGPMHAANWEGFRFHMDALTRKGIVQNDEGVWVDGERVLPTKGWVVNPPQAGAAPSTARTNTRTATRTTTRTTPRTATHTEVVVVDPADLALITHAAKTTTDLGAFADAVMDLTGVDGEKMISNADIMSMINPDTWTKLKES
jgi:hypothetical protein